MRQASKRIPESAEKAVRDIRRATRRHHRAAGDVACCDGASLSDAGSHAGFFSNGINGFDSRTRPGLTVFRSGLFYALPLSRCSRVMFRPAI